MILGTLSACTAKHPVPTERDTTAIKGAVHSTMDDPTYLYGKSIGPSIITSIEAGIEAGSNALGTFGPLRIYVMTAGDDNRSMIEDFCAHSRRREEPGTPEEQIYHCAESFELPESGGEIFSSVHHHSHDPFAAIVFINPDTPSGSDRGPNGLMMAAIHEYTHIFQAAFQEPGGPDPAHPEQQIPGPAWLTEGAATYQSIALSGSGDWIEKAHEQSKASFRSAVLTHGVFLNNGETYDELEDSEIIHAVLYEGGSAAVKWLIDNHSGEIYWGEFYAAIPLHGWETAFERTFGMPVDAFYGAFRDYLGVDHTHAQ